LPPGTCSVARSRPGTVRGVEPNWAGTLLHHSTLPHLPRHKFNSHSTILTICLGHCSTTEWVPDSTNQWCVGLEAVEPAAIHCRRELCAEARPRSNLFWTNSSPLPRPHSTYCIRQSTRLKVYGNSKGMIAELFLKLKLTQINVIF